MDFEAVQRHLVAHQMASGRFDDFINPIRGHRFAVQGTESLLKPLRVTMNPPKS